MPSGEGLHPSAATVAVVLDEMAPGAEVRQLDSSTRSAAEAAAALGSEVGAIASSLVFMAVDGPVLIMTSGAHRVDLDLVVAGAGLTGLRKATAGEVRAATGQAIGGVAPVGHPAPPRTVVDRHLARYPKLWAARERLMRYTPPPSSSWWPSPPAPCCGSPATDRHSSCYASRASASSPR
jgi:prolyl-tRNA editing enzyme YbaK/EbsC (Cys-tRNA(Pro) deacylase)